MAIANITGNILTDSGVATSSLLPLTGGTLTGAITVNSGGSPSVFNTDSAQGIAIENGQASNKRYRLNVSGTSFAISESGVGSHLTIAAGGNVGIGTSSPSALLTLLKDSNIGINTSDGSDNGYLALCGAGGDGSARGGHIYLSGNERGADAGTVVLSAGNVADGAIMFRTGASTERMRIRSNGTICMNNTDTDEVILNIHGNNTTSGTAMLRNPGKGSNVSHIHYDTNGDWYIRPANNSGSVYVKNYVAESDARLKDNIENISYGLNEILNLKPRKFNWKESTNEVNGFIAQEVEEIIPALVNEGQWKSVDYQGITAILVKAIQELSAKVSALENK